MILLYNRAIEAIVNRLASERAREREREKEMAAEQTSKPSKAYPMKGGDSVDSYSNNSSYQVLSSTTFFR